MNGLRNAFRDPRIYQIAILSGLLIYGLTSLGFAIWPGQLLATLGGALGTQLVAGWIVGTKRYDARSPLISGLSLCLLLRTNDPGLGALAGILAIGSKFVIRHRGKHVFNPTNVALVALLLATDRVWVSPGQWGSAAFLAFFFACLGGLVVNRAARSDVTYAFLASFALIVLGRSLWLGDPLAVPLHKLQSGALLLFAFFMISDPKTTPNRRAGRVLFAFLNAAVAAVIVFRFHEPNGLLYALAMLAPMVSFIDRVIQGEQYEWARVRPTDSKGATSHVSETSTRAARARDGAATSHRAGLLRLLRGQGRHEAVQ